MWHASHRCQRWAWGLSHLRHGPCSASREQRAQPPRTPDSNRFLHSTGDRCADLLGAARPARPQSSYRRARGARRTARGHRDLEILRMGREDLRQRKWAGDPTGPAVAFAVQRRGLRWARGVAAGGTSREPDARPKCEGKIALVGCVRRPAKKTRVEGAAGASDHSVFSGPRPRSRKACYRRAIRGGRPAALPNREPVAGVGGSGGLRVRRRMVGPRPAGYASPRLCAGPALLRADRVRLSRGRRSVPHRSRSSGVRQPGARHAPRHVRHGRARRKTIGRGRARRRHGRPPKWKTRHRFRGDGRRPL